MKTNNVLGIIFANAHDSLLSRMTKNRAMASVPFGGRYCLTDFLLSNFANAGISHVGVITKTNYLSLTNHLSNGKPWDLDRKKGGLRILPPYVTGSAHYYTRRLEMLNSIIDFLVSCDEEYILLGGADVVANIDFKQMLKFHKEKGADITFVYAKGKKPRGQNDVIDFDLDQNSRVKGVSFEDNDNCNYGLDTMVMERKLLISLINEGMRCGQVSLSHGIFERKYNELGIYGFEHTGFSAVIDSIESYYKASMALLDNDVRKDLFNPARPIHTRTRDDMPAKYGINAKASNSLIADGCTIKGSVKNSILFRGVVVEEGAEVENCILMSDTIIGKDCRISNIISDRSVELTKGKILDGTAIGYYIDKNKII